MKRIDDPVGKAIEVFQQEFTESAVGLSALANAVVSHVPVVGPYLVEALKAKRHQKLAERITELFSMLKGEVERLDKTKIDLEAVQSEEFQSVLLLVLRNLETTEEKEKLEYFKNILVNSMVVGKAPTPDKKMFLSFVRELSVEHIHLLKEVYAKYQVSGIVMIGELQRMFPSWPPDKVRWICNDLARYWLLADTPIVGDQYRVTRRAEDFLRFILSQGRG